MSKLSQFSRSLAIVKKDMLILYLKGPVVIMGLLFPFFLFGAFLIGRNLSHEYLFVALFRGNPEYFPHWLDLSTLLLFSGVAIHKRVLERRFT